MVLNESEYCYITFYLQENLYTYNQDHSPEVDDVEGLAADATRHLELHKQKDKAESNFLIEKAGGKLHYLTD